MSECSTRHVPAPLPAAVRADLNHGIDVTLPELCSRTNCCAVCPRRSTSPYWGGHRGVVGRALATRTLTREPIPVLNGPSLSAPFDGPACRCHGSRQPAVDAGLARSFAAAGSRRVPLWPATARRSTTSTTVVGARGDAERSAFPSSRALGKWRRRPGHGMHARDWRASSSPGIAGSSPSTRPPQPLPSRCSTSGPEVDQGTALCRHRPTSSPTLRRRAAYDGSVAPLLSLLEADRAGRRSARSAARRDHRHPPRPSRAAVVKRLVGADTRRSGFRVVSTSFPRGCSRFRYDAWRHRLAPLDSPPLRSASPSAFSGESGSESFYRSMTSSSSRLHSAARRRHLRPRRGRSHADKLLRDTPRAGGDLDNVVCRKASTQSSPASVGTTSSDRRSATLGCRLPCHVKITEDDVATRQAGPPRVPTTMSSCSPHQTAARAL